MIAALEVMTMRWTEAAVFPHRFVTADSVQKFRALFLSIAMSHLHKVALVLVANDNFKFSWLTPFPSVSIKRSNVF